MIRLTLKSANKPIYISPEAITSIYNHGENGSEVFLGDDMSAVTESPEEVARKVLEYRLAMEEYKLMKLFDADYESLAEKLFRLAGLEEPKDD